MSYSATGSYYEFSPHEIYPTHDPTSGFGAVDRAKAIGFNAAQVWGYVQKSDACYAPSGPHFATCKANATAKPCGTCNFYGGKATRKIQAGLHELGYNPGPVDGAYGGRTISAWKKFTADVGVPSGTLASREGVMAMESQLRGGKKPGPGPRTCYDKSGIPIDCPKDGMGMAGLGIGLLLVAGVAAVVLIAGKKKKGSAPTRF